MSEKPKPLFQFGIKRQRVEAQEDTQQSQSHDTSCDTSSRSIAQIETVSVSGTHEDSSSDASLEGCTGAYCTNLEPNQPRDRSILNKTTLTIGTQKRLVNSDWFNCYLWMTLCKTWNVLFCHSCMEADRKKLITFSMKSDEAFLRMGFSAWKNALAWFVKHHASDTHKEAVAKLHRVATVNIAAALNSKAKEQQLKRQQMLLKHLFSLHYLCRQGLAIWGHDSKWYLLI